MACLGACSSFGSLLFGRVSDKFGRLPVLALAGVFHGTGARAPPLPLAGAGPHAPVRAGVLGPV